MRDRVRVFPTIASEGRLVLKLLAVVIEDHPEWIRKLLREYKVSTSNKPDGLELTNKVIYAIDVKGKEFHEDLAELLAIKLSDVEDFDGYAKEENEDHYANLIAGAIGGIGTAVGSLTGKKQKRAEASRQTMATLMGYSAQKEKVKADRERRSQQHTNRMKLVKVIGGVVIIGGVLYLLLKKSGGPNEEVFTEQQKPVGFKIF